MISFADPVIDNLLERTARISRFAAPRQRDVTSLLNWLDGTAALAREETEYLHHSRDLMCLAQINDGFIGILDGLIEDTLIRFYKDFRDVSKNIAQEFLHIRADTNCYSRAKLPEHALSRDPNVYIHTGPRVRQLSQLVLSTLVAFLLLLPVVICYVVQSMAIRILTICAANLFLLVTMSSLSYFRTFELFIVGAT